MRTLTYTGLTFRLAATWFGVVALLATLAVADLLHLHRGPSVAVIYFVQQDLPLLFGGVLLMGLLARTSPHPLNLTLAPPRGWPWMLAGAAGLWALAGAWFGFGGYPLSLDEFMVDFDQRIFRSGALFAPLPEIWRPYAEALQPIFVIHTPGHVAWASGYLPVNAAIRTLASFVGGEIWVNPIWTLAAVLAVVAVARRLCPDRPQLAIVAGILLATSSQVLVTGMSAYAMPAHLALNLLWLWGFLRGGKGGLALALLCGFLATGLHQLVFHPMFAAPFVLQLWLERRWRPALLYTLGYALICGFWLMYWPLALSLSHVPAGGVAGAGGPVWFAENVAGLLSRFDPLNAGAMSLDLVRFVVWQHPLTVPLALLGIMGAVRARGTLAAAALGVAITIGAVFVLLPYQDHGWGYRYLHGQLGSICLLAAWSWERLTARMDLEGRRAATTAFLTTTAAAVLVMAPVNTWQAANYLRPYAAAAAAIERTRADVVIVDDQASWYTESLVRNDPRLALGPKVMNLANLDAAQVRQLCATHTVAIFDRHDAALFGIAAAKADNPARAATTGRLRALMRGLGCGMGHMSDRS